MTNLLPCEQKVLNAAEYAYDYNYSEFHCCANSVAAYTLRALVKEYSFKDLGFIALVSADHILDLADKLEHVYD
jgi:uncharacterized membrane-anchored protein